MSVKAVQLYQLPAPPPAQLPQFLSLPLPSRSLRGVEDLDLVVLEVSPPKAGLGLVRTTGLARSCRRMTFLVLCAA
jgi:hypothetical protein